MRPVILGIASVSIALGSARSQVDGPFDEKVLAQAFELSKTCAKECSNAVVYMKRLALPQGKRGFLIITNDLNFCGSGGCSTVVVVHIDNKFVKLKEGLGISERDAISIAQRDQHSAQSRSKVPSDLLIGTWEADHHWSIKGTIKTYLNFDGRGNVIRIDREPGEWVAYKSYYIIKSASEFDWGGMKASYAARGQSLELRYPNGTRVFTKSNGPAPVVGRQIVEAVLPPPPAVASSARPSVPTRGGNQVSQQMIAATSSGRHPSNAQQQQSSFTVARDSGTDPDVLQCVRPIFQSGQCSSVSISNVRKIDRRITSGDAIVIAEIDFRVQQPFSGSSPVALTCTGTSWDMDPTKVRSTPDPTLSSMLMPPIHLGASQNWFLAGQGLRIRKAFQFLKFESGWRCSTATMQPVEGGFYLNQ